MLPSQFLQSKKFCKGRTFRWDANSNMVACCTIGAIEMTLPANEHFKFENVLSLVIGASFIAAWNDRPKTTKEMAVAALRETEKRLGLK